MVRPFDKAGERMSIESDSNTAAQLIESGTSDDFNLGLSRKMKQLRESSGLRLSDVAKLANCSQSAISKIERGQMSPTVNMLHRLANAYEVNIAELFDQPTETTGFVVRRDARPVLPPHSLRRGDGISLESLLPMAHKGVLQSYLHVIESGGQSDGMISHDGEEFGYVLEGCLKLKVGSHVEVLYAGDTFFFQSDIPHGYANHCGETTKVIWVNTPPTY